MLRTVLAGLVALGVSGLAIPVVLRFAARRLLDIPNERSSHQIPVPRGGGIALTLGVAAGLIAGGDVGPVVVSVFGLSLCLGLVGLADDLRRLPVSTRLMSQVAVAIAGSIVATDLVPWDWRFLIVCVWIIGFSNAFNFMDGVNGISGAQLLVVGSGWVVCGLFVEDAQIVTVGVATAGAAAGFLPWNFPRAQIFLGDVGSYFAGAWISLVVVWGFARGVPLAALVAPLLIYVVDTGLTLARRASRREPLTVAHHGHVYQQLVDGGMTHTAVTLLFVLCATGLGALGVVSVRGPAVVDAAAVLTGLLIIVLYAVSPLLLLRSRRPQRVARRRS